MEEYIVLLGRAGLEYYDKQGIQYFVDSELYLGDPYDYAICRQYPANELRQEVNQGRKNPNRGKSIDAL